MTTADVVLSALLSFATADGRVAAPLAEIAALTDLHEGAVRRALAQLCRERRLDAVGKTGRNTIFQIPAEHRRAATASRRDATPKEESSSSSSTSDRSTARDPEPPVARQDDVLTAKEKDELRRIGLAALYPILDGFGDDELGAPDQPGGECSECGAEARARWSFGLYVLCRDCRARRAAVAARLAEEPVVVPPAGETIAEELTVKALDALTAQRSTNGHGNGASWIDAPELDY